MTSPLAQALELPCGAVLPNRICKAAMTEGIADEHLRANTRHERLYRLWSEGGAGLLLTGNVQIDREVLERPGNVAIDLAHGGDGPEHRTALKRWAAAGTAAGNHLWMQIAHAGRQSPKYVTRRTVGPSAVPLKLLGNYAPPRALTEAEILDFIARFAKVAGVARECGFTGVQMHSAHGYLLSSFLSPHDNRRTDAWGGSIENRARFLVEILRAVRKVVGSDFPVGVKLNSDDFRKGGFSHEDCLKVVQLLNGERVDLLEISGGTYEQPRLLGAEGDRRSAAPMRASTQRREAYFLEYAHAIRQVAKMPLMVTGGFRSRAGMEAALASGDCDVIGLGRPLCTDADAPRRLLAGALPELPRHERTVSLGRSRWLTAASPSFALRAINVLGAQGWYYRQLQELADHGRPLADLSLLRAFAWYLRDELAAAKRVHRARRT